MSLDPRENYLQEVKKLLISLGSTIFDFAVKEHRERLSAIEAGTFGQAGNLGILASTDEALVMGMTMEEEIDVKPTLAAAVVAFTVINGVPLTVNLYHRPYEGEITITDLLKGVQLHVKTLVAANPDAATSQ